MTVQPTAIPKLVVVKEGKIRWRRRELVAGLLFILPSLIGFIAFYAVPAIRGVTISFTNWDLLTPAKPVGLQNYVKLLNDPVFWNSLKVTVY
ncbi:MAG: carbohydrate ABC transporter permease, partial [Nitrososphaerales archaeon]